MIGMKKVLLSAYACDPSKGSENANGWNWAIELAKLNYTVHIITTSEGKDKVEKELAKYEGLKLYFHFIDHNKFWKRAYFWHFSLMYIAYFLWQYKIFIYAKKLHKKEKFNIVHHVTWGSVKIGSFLCKLDNIKFIFGPVGGGHKAPKVLKKYFYEDWSKEVFRNFANDFVGYLNPLTRYTLKKSTVVFATNDETVNFAKKNGATNVKLVIDSALSAKFIRKSPPERKNVKFNLLWLGRLYSFKGLGLVLDAFANLDQKIKEKIEFNIVGDGPFRNKFLEIIKEKKLEEFINFHGMIPFSDVNTQYSKADAFIFCSLRDSCPAQHLEAMSFGLPIITLNIHGSKLIVPDDAGIKISVIDEETTVNDISKAILKLFTDDKLRLLLGENAFNYSQKSIWSIKIRDIAVEFYN